MYKKKQLKNYNYIKNIVYDTVPLMTLDWCKLIEAEAGWVSDNYLAYCRLNKWIHHSTTMYNEEGTDNDVYDQSVTEMNMMIGSLLSMVAVIMEKKVTHDKSNMMDSEIKYFLSNVDKVDTSLVIGRKNFLFG